LRRILVIRLGALGDFVQSFGPFAAIRAHHEDARIALLTTKPFHDLAGRAPWFDEVLVDERPEWWNVAALARLSRMLRGFDFVYDLQTSARSSRYFRLAGRIPWSGIAAGCSHPHANPRRDFMHTRERQREQLEMAGIGAFPLPDLSWLTAGSEGFDLPSRYAVLVPGAAPHRPAKRWPAARFASLARELAGGGLRSIVLGAKTEGPAAGLIAGSCPEAIDLTGRTAMTDIAGIAARAQVAIGNDTGPMHLAAAVGCPSVVLFSAESDPALTSPRYPDGGWPTVLRADKLAGLPVARVAAALP
jgi:ADP-heptose:LPS heptosyltransferase